METSRIILAILDSGGRLEFKPSYDSSQIMINLSYRKGKCGFVNLSKDYLVNTPDLPFLNEALKELFRKVTDRDLDDLS